MLKKIYFSLMLLAFLSSCKKSNQPEAVAKVELNFPSAYFTELSLVGKANASPVIMDKLIAMIDATPKNASINLAIYGFSHQGIIEALKRASIRGVKLYLLIDYSLTETQDENRPTVIAIRSFLNSDSEVLTVKNDATASSIQHCKFVLFSELNTQNGLVKDVVFSTSHNFNIADSKKIQDAIVLNQPALYQAFLTYFNEVKSRAASGMKNYSYQQFIDEKNGLEAQFYPKRKNGVALGDDSVIELLDGITEPSTATVRVGMSDWTVSRLNVVNKLQDLANKGAKVEVIAKSKADAGILAGLENLRKSGAFVKVYNISQTNIHSKFFMIEGKWKGVQAKVLATGSHNLTGNALRNNNEVLLILKNYNTLYDSYVNYYDEMKKL
ncbi:phospholipase D-like domain-containing protein [Pedobacter alpinus]|uniref:phospholipase D n=1 Tax=Pedobacter alpinus TaxID=1590643 RepID=A0ABW5TT15_9SPHI